MSRVEEFVKVLLVSKNFVKPTTATPEALWKYLNAVVTAAILLDQLIADHELASMTLPKEQ